MLISENVLVSDVADSASSAHDAYTPKQKVYVEMHYRFSYKTFEIAFFQCSVEAHRPMSLFPVPDILLNVPVIRGI